MWTFQCKNSKDTITYDPKTINSSNPPNCRNGKVKTINLWTLHKESEEDPGKVEMSVYSKSDSAYLDGNNDFITTLEPIKTGATVATLAESSNRKLACGQSQPGVEDICIDGKPAVKLRPRSAYDELAKTLIMIHNRFIDSPDADNITIVADDKISEKIIASVMDRAKMAGFYKINRAKTTEIYKASIAEIQKANRNNLAAYELMKDKNFAKCADSVLEKVDNLQISDCHTEDDSGGIGTEDIDMGSGDGSRSKQEIMQVVNARMPGLGNIYNKYLNLKPGFSGKVVLKFTIAPGGDIISIAIVSSTTDYFEFDNAVKNMVATWKWKVIKSGNTTITVPFNFE
jgi:TonB family protein